MVISRLLMLGVICYAFHLRADDDRYAAVSGDYQNHNYGYAVTIPGGLRGFKTETARASSRDLHSIGRRAGRFRRKAESESRSPGTTRI